MTRLSQIIAVEQTAKAEGERAREQAQRLLAPGNAAQMTGLSRTYRPYADDAPAEDHRPPEQTNVQIKAEDVLADLTASLTRMFDVALTVENGNAGARADVKVGSHVILSDAPVTYLLFLEKQLAELQGFLRKLPVVDPAEEWAFDDAAGVLRTPERKTQSSKKIPRNHVLAAATKEHPAQVQVYMEDAPVGEWSTVKFTGALKAERVRALQERTAELIRAVKYARMEANAGEIADRRAGEQIFRYILTGYNGHGAQAQA